MPTTTPHLASWWRRLVAAAFDTMVLLLVLVAVVGVCSAMDVSAAFAFPLFALAYLGYHFSGLLVPRVGFGRVVAGISVVSIRDDGSITRGQAFIRPFIRLVAVIAAFFVGAMTSNLWFAAIPVAVEIALIMLLPMRQSLADLLARTIVVNAPQPEPHRAPAGPMFSATDAEFGFPPRRARKAFVRMCTGR